MKGLFTRWKWLKIVEGVLIIALGVVLAVCCWLNGFDITLGYIVAAFLLADGLMLLILYLVPKDTEINTGLVVCGSTIALSVLLFVYPGLLFGYLPIIVGSLLIVFAIFETVIASRKLINKEKVLYIVMSYSLAAIALVAGILFMYYGIAGRNDGVNTAAQIIVCFVGVVVVYAGIMLIVSSCIASHQAKKALKESNKE